MHTLVLSTIITLPLRTTNRTASVAYSTKPPQHHTIAQQPPNTSLCQSYKDLAVRCHETTFHISRRGQCRVAGPYRPCSHLQQVNEQHRSICVGTLFHEESTTSLINTKDQCQHLVKSESPTNATQQQTNDNHRL
jgi:hypothetical protein